MDPRRQIPVLSLLGLCLTECTHGDDGPGIVGTWTAIEIDMEKFPMVEMGEGYTSRYGVGLRVHADLSAAFGYYYAAHTSEGIGQRGENYMPATVDADDAPRYLITVEYYGHVDYDVAEEPPGVAARRIDPIGPGVLRSRATPQAADNTIELDCTLNGDNLDCNVADGEGKPTIVKFARKLEET
jgi:hypothetical protein